MTKYFSSWAVLIAAVLSAFASAPCWAEPVSVAELVKTAVEGTGQQRYAAIDDLGERHESAATAVPALEKLLANQDAQVRWRAARALGDYGSQAQSTAPALQKLLSQGGPIEQYHAAAALGKIGDRSDATIEALVQAVAHSDGRVARTAIAALRNLEPDPTLVAGALKHVLTSDDEAVLLYAMEAIVERGAAAAPLLNEALKQPETAYLAAAAIERIGPEAKATVPALAELLTKTKHSQVLIQALLAISSIGPEAKSAEPQIVPLFESPTDDTTVPVAAAYALGSIGATGADAELKKAAASDDPMLQMIAAWALAKCHPDDEMLMRQAIAQLALGLRSDDAMQRMAAARCAVALNAPTEMVAPTMIALANDPDPHVQENVISALASRGEAVVPRASNALKNPKLRGLAVRVLAQVGPQAKEAVKSLMEVAPDADPEFRSQIHAALAAIGPDAAPATDLLIEGLTSDDEGVRHSALYAVREIGPGASKAGPKLVELLQSSEGFDQLAAAWALARIVPDKQRVAEHIATVLRQGLADPDEAERIETISAISDLGASGAVLRDDLKRIASEDPDMAVREVAQTALEKLGS